MDEDFCLVVLSYFGDGWIGVPGNLPSSFQFQTLYTLYADVIEHSFLQLDIDRNTVLVYEFKLHGLSPRANYTDRATAACRRSDCQLSRIEGATWSA
jgi:hypothetical protein